MSTTAALRNEVDFGLDRPRRLSTETKTVELAVSGGAVVVTRTSTARRRQQDGGDPFGATTASTTVVYLTIAHLVSRGLAQSGSPENYTA